MSVDADLLTPVELTWDQLGIHMRRLAVAITGDGTPRVVVGVLRGGMIPAICLARILGVRDVRAIEVTHTIDDARDAAKTPLPSVRNSGSLGELAGADVLIVDDVAGTGDTLTTAVHLAEAAGAARVRTAVWAVNRNNWLDERAPEDVVPYIGLTTCGWVVFPWERIEVML